jgi:hypothetical protein
MNVSHVVLCMLQDLFIRLCTNHETAHRAVVLPVLFLRHYMSPRSQSGEVPHHRPDKSPEPLCTALLRERKSAVLPIAGSANKFYRTNATDLRSKNQRGNALLLCCSPTPSINGIITRYRGSKLNEAEIVYLAAVVFCGFSCHHNSGYVCQLRHCYGKK